MTKKLTTEDLIRAADISRDDLKNFVRRGLLAFRGRPGVAREFTRDEVLLAIVIISIRDHVHPDKLQEIARQLVTAAKDGVEMVLLSHEKWIAVAGDADLDSAFRLFKDGDKQATMFTVASLKLLQSVLDRVIENDGLSKER